MKGGTLVYEKGQTPVFNDLLTPVAGQYRLVLSDGTKVWLDALSAIHYPTLFNGKDREGWWPSPAK